MALCSEAPGSIVDIVAAPGAYLMVRISLVPPDRRYPLGHTKIEYLPAVFADALIVLSAVVDSRYIRILLPTRPGRVFPGRVVLFMA